MRTLTVLSVAFFLVQCSASGGSVGQPTPKVQDQQAKGPMDAAACVAPTSADTFEADSGIGCRPSLDCSPQSDGGEVCTSGCLASQYELLCTGVGTSFAPHPADALNCSLEGLPGQTANLLHYCCACPSN
jgi:hypothetical protein